MATLPHWNFCRELELQFFPVETQGYAIRVSTTHSPVRPTECIAVTDSVIRGRLIATTALGIQGDPEQVRVSFALLCFCGTFIYDVYGIAGIVSEILVLARLCGSLRCWSEVVSERTDRMTRCSVFVSSGRTTVIGKSRFNRRSLRSTVRVAAELC